MARWRANSGGRSCEFVAGCHQAVLLNSRVSRSGDTLTGPLVLAGDPATPSQAATKGYVDARQLSSALPKTGGTLCGAPNY